MATIKGYLKDGASKAITDAAIILKAQKTSNTVLVKTEAFEVAKNGYYEMNVPPCIYEVILLVDGCPPKQLGIIEVFEKSKSGTLNDFLIMPKTGKIVDEDIIEQMTEQRIKAQNAAQKAVDTVNNTVKKTGEKEQTINGNIHLDGMINITAPAVAEIITKPSLTKDIINKALISSNHWGIFNGNDNAQLGSTANITIASWNGVGFAPLHNVNSKTQNSTVVINVRNGTVNAKSGFYENGIKLIKEGDPLSITRGNITVYKYTPELILTDVRNQNTSEVFTNESCFGIVACDPEFKTRGTKLRYTIATKVWDFEKVNNVTINNKPILKQGDYGIGSYGATFTDENFDEMNVDQSGFYRLGKESKGKFPQGFSEFCSMIHITRSDNIADKKGSQIIVDTYTNRIAYRTTHVSGFKPWSEFVTTANLAKLAHRFNGNLADKNLNNLTGSNSGFYFQNASKSATTERGYPINEAGSLNIIQNDADGPAGCVQIYTTYRSARQFIRTYKSLIKEWGKWIEQITTANSTVDSNGFLKKASPILRLFANDEMEAIDGFKKSGCALVNDLATGVTAKRIDVGHYEIHGSLGFAKEGWYITLPEDANGNKKFFAEYSTDENNIITVKTFTKKFDFERCEIVAGQPIDISAERWIDLRLEMPELVITDKVEPIASVLNPVVI